MTEPKATPSMELDPEDVPAAAAFIADQLEAAAARYLEKGRTKAAHDPLRRLLMPNYYVRSWRMRNEARRLRKSAIGGTGNIEIVQSHIAQLARREKSGLDVVIGDIKVVQLGAEVAHREKNNDLEGLAALAPRILGHSSLDARARAKLLRNPAMLLAIRDMVPGGQPSPASQTPGRVAYVAASSLPYSVAGYTTRTEGVALGYSALGLDIRVVTRPPFPLNIRTDLEPADVPDVEVFNGVEYHRLKSPVQRELSPLEYIVQAAEAMTEKLRQLAPEAVIAGSNHINALPALIAARRLGVPFTYEVRGFWEVSRLAREPHFADTSEFAVSQQLEAYVAQSADHVLTLTAQMRDDLVNRGVQRDKIDLMPNGVSSEFVQSNPRDMTLAKTLGVPEGCPVIGYIGSILEYEGLQDLARACAGLSNEGLDFRLLLVGHEKPDAAKRTPISDEIKDIFESASISERLLMPGRVPFSEVERYYSLVDIAPVPRRPYDVAHLVSPIKPLEAMAKAKALVVSDVSALRDLVEDGVTGVVFQAGDPDDLQQKLSHLLRHPEHVVRIQEAGQEFVRNNRTWKSICAASAAAIRLKPSALAEPET